MPNMAITQDATWITASNSMKCHTAADVYLMLKSSNFITHDLLQPFEGETHSDTDTLHDLTLDSSNSTNLPSTTSATTLPISYSPVYGGGESSNSALSFSDVELVLRKWSEINVSLEFRCFVRKRELIGICQRDMNYFAFLHQIKEEIVSSIEEFFEKNLQTSFMDDSCTYLLSQCCCNCASNSDMTSLLRRVPPTTSKSDLAY